MTNIATFFLVAFVASQSVVLGEFDRERDGLKGPVQSVHTSHAIILEEDGHRTAGPRVPLNTVSYEKSGNRKEIVNYEEGGALKSRAVYTYDQQGQVRRSGIENFDSRGMVTRKVSYRFNGSGAKVGETQEVYDEGQLYRRREISFDNLGMLLGVAEYSPEGKLVRRDKAPLEQSIAPGRGRGREAVKEEDRMISFGWGRDEVSGIDSQGNWTKATTYKLEEYASGKKRKRTEEIYREIIYYQ